MVRHSEDDNAMTQPIEIIFSKGVFVLSYKVDGTNITLTRGDTLRIRVKPYVHGTTDLYSPEEGDSMRFAVKKTYNDETVAIYKPIPVDTCVLYLPPEMTKEMAYGKYVYDIELTYATGDIDTFVKGTFVLTEEVD